MGRLVPVVRVLALIIMATAAGYLSGCGSSDSLTSNTTFTTPLKVSLSPSPSSSLELGTTVSFSASATNSSNTGLNENFAYESSDPSIVTVTTSGQACAGSWDSLTAPTKCTPGKVGVAQITAVAQGISSPPTSVYVHQHIDSIIVQAQPGQAAPQSSSCFSKGQTYRYQATAYSRQGAPAPGLDITSTVGPFIWQVVNASVVTIVGATPTSPISGLLPGEGTATANVPGTSPIFVTASGVSSEPFTFNTCLVQSITLAPSDNGGNSVSVARGGTTDIDATVTDTLGNVITGSFLTWCSSNPGSVSTSTSNCSLGATTNFAATASSSGGGAAVTAACSPPNCNINVFPTLPVYAPTPVSVLATGTTTSGTVTSTAWVTTTGCKGSDGCTSELAPITATLTASAPTYTVGTLVVLPATPNSLVFNGSGTTAFLGTDNGELGTRGVMVLDAGGKTVSEFPQVVGKVLAVSPDGGTAIVSDTINSPNQVYVFSCSPGAATSSGTTSAACGGASATPLDISGATAAAFSPDGLKAYILSNVGAASTLYIYSKLDALQSVLLSSSAPANDVAFLPQGNFGYIAGGAASAVSMVPICTGAAPPVITRASTAGTPVTIRSLPNGNMLALDPPGFDFITPAVSGTGCSVPRPPYESVGDLSITNTVPAPFVNLGQGNFVPTQLIISTDGLNAYLLTQSFGGVIVFNIAARTTSAISLVGNVLPLSASLSPDGTQLFVGASDGTVHVLDTVGGADLHQIAFQAQPANLQSGLCGNVNFPTQSVIDITAASQNGVNTTFTYTLTSGPSLQVGRRITITAMGNAGNNGAFTIAALGNGSFTVSNAIGVTASGQSGAGSVAFACNPDLVAVAP